MNKFFILIFTLFIGVLSSIPLHSQVGERFKDNQDLEYEIISVNPNKVSIEGYSGKNSTLSIPEQTQYNGENYTITSIGFKNDLDYFITGVSELILPKTLETIYRGSIGSALKTLYINSDLTWYVSDYYKDIFPGDGYITPWLYSVDLSGLTTVTFGEGVTTIPCFYLANRLETVNLPSTIKSLPDGAFCLCKSLKNITLPDGLETIGFRAFYGCTNLSSIKLPETIKSIGYSSFTGTSISSIKIPDNIDNLEYSMFSGCTSLESISLPSNLKLIGNSAFAYCSELNEIVLPAGIQEIGNGAFAYCSKLKEINIPGSLQVLGGECFRECTNLQTVILSDSEDLLTIYPEGNYYGGPLFYNCPLKSLYLGRNIEYPNDTNYTFYGSPFQEIPTLEKVTISDEVNTLPANLFLGCSSLSNFELPSNLKTIGPKAFSGCSSLTSMVIPEGVTSIPDNLFTDCINLEKIYISDNISSFGISAFQNCTSLRSIVIPEGVKEIPQNLLQGCSSINEILVPNSVTAIGQNAFQGCSSLRNLVLGTGTYSIGDYAFAECNNLIDIYSLALNPPYAEMYTFPVETYTNATVTVREQSLEKYNSENPWYRFQNYLTIPGSVSLSHYKVDMAGNEVFQLGVYGSDNKIQWTSSNPSVAYANECGLIVAMGITGSTVITAHVDGEEINCNVTVSSPYRDPQAYTRVGDEENIQPVDIIMEGVGGNPPMVNVRLVPVGSKTIIDWTSSDSALATVNNGLVTVYADGEVDFGVETENGLEDYVEVDTKNIDQAGIEEIFAESDLMKPLNVYDLNGRILLFNATIEQIRHLNKGLYIIKDKKVLIK